MELLEVTKSFGIDEIISITEINGGHINNTFLIESKNGRYILQSLNSEVFLKPKTVMKNIAKLQRVFENTEQTYVQVPHYLYNSDNLNYTEHDGKIYRMYEYIEPSETDLNNKYRSAGFAFGSFIRILGEKSTKLEPTIENYHSYSAYFAQLVTADKNSSLKKIDSIIMRRLDSLEDTLKQVFTVDFPKRNIHGDAKINNIILGKNTTVIDLDTVMKGYAAIDYGDMIRSFCTSEKLNLTLIRDTTNGFAEGLNGTLNDDEIYSLYYGILYVTGELAVRYLTDYLSGGKYFKDKTASSCLSRANELLRQLSIFISHGDEITAIIYKAFKKSNLTCSMLI